jgi:hypothetical protein
MQVDVTSSCAIISWKKEIGPEQVSVSQKDEINVQYHHHHGLHCA